MNQHTFAMKKKLLRHRDSRALQQVLEMTEETVSGKQILLLSDCDDTLARRLTETAADITALVFEDVRKYEVRQPVPENLHYRQGDAAELPFLDGVFDAVIAADTLHLRDDAETVMNEIIRVLKPDGVLIAPACVHNDMTVNHTLADLALRRTVAYQPARRWTKNSYIDFLHQYGWHIRKGRMIRTAAPYAYAYAECIRKRSTQ